MARDRVVIYVLGKGLFKGLGITLKHGVEREITVQYPEETPFLEERFRGSLCFQMEKCIACGLCIKTCPNPNHVLTLETYVPEGSKKKQTLRYTIDRQYCLFCNLCVEICPTDTLYFSHDFELTQLRREDIKVVYTRSTRPELFRPAAPSSMPGPAPQAVEAPRLEVPVPEAPQAAATPPITVVPEAPARAGGEIDSAEASAEASAAQARRSKQIEAIKTALDKNPQRALAKIVEQEEDSALLVSLIREDAKKLSRLVELMVDDREKAHKFAAALVNKAKQGAGGGGPA